MRRIIPFALLFLFVSTLTVAQVNDPKKRAKQKAENRTNQKIDEAIDEGLDKIGGLFKRKKKKKKKQETSDNDDNMMNGLFGGDNAEIKETYSFKGQMDVKITHTEGKGKNKQSEQNMRYLFPKEEDAPLGFEVLYDEGNGNQEATVIMDWESGTMLTVLEEQQIISVTNLDKEAMEESTAEAIEEQNGELQDFEKTGRTKEILGYTCHEYTFENEKAKGVMWVTEDIELNPVSMMGGMGKSMKQKDKLPNYPNGMYLEAHFEDKKSGDTTDWETTAIDMEKESSVTTSNYRVMNLGGKR